MSKPDKPPRPTRDDAREERIDMEIVVDCYNEHEAWSGWCCYLEDHLSFPFQAECIRVRRGAPLKTGERVKVIGMFNDDEAAYSLAPMQVEVVWQGHTLAVPLAQLRGLDVAAPAAEAIADWHYWVAQRRHF
jgi:hypothetical protein